MTIETKKLVISEELKRKIEMICKFAYVEYSFTNGYIDIKPEEIKKIKIKNEDFIYKRITIILNDGTKYIMNSAKEVKGVNYHQENLNKFIEIYK